MQSSAYCNLNSPQDDVTCALIIFLVVFLKSVAEDVCPVCRSGGAPQAAHFANVEDMLFEVFRCEETDTFDRISIRQFLKVRRERHTKLKLKTVIRGKDIECTSHFEGYCTSLIKGFSR